MARWDCYVTFTWAALLAGLGVLAADAAKESMGDMEALSFALVGVGYPLGLWLFVQLVVALAHEQVEIGLTLTKLDAITKRNVSGIYRFSPRRRVNIVF